jgi:hypothetical protein
MFLLLQTNLKSLSMQRNMHRKCLSKASLGKNEKGLGRGGEKTLKPKLTQSTVRPSSDKACDQMPGALSHSTLSCDNGRFSQCCSLPLTGNKTGWIIF